MKVVHVLAAFGAVFLAPVVFAQSLVYPVGNSTQRPTAASNNPNGYYVSRRFSEARTDGALHSGVDLANGAEGGEVRSIGAGTVTLVLPEATSSGFGIVVMIRHDLTDGTVYSIYAHLQNGSVVVSFGDTVFAGQKIGQVDCTGATEGTSSCPSNGGTGAHLHFSIKRSSALGCGYISTKCTSESSMANYIDPLSFIDARIVNTPPPPSAAYSVLDLTPTLQANSTSCYALQPPTRISNYGMVIGRADDPCTSSYLRYFQGYSWEPEAVAAPNPICARLADINDTNTVLSTTGTLNETWVQVGPASGCYQPYQSYRVNQRFFEATAVNNLSHAIGYESVAGQLHATLFAGGSITDLGTLVGTSSTVAQGINDVGSVVGTATNANCAVPSDCRFAVLFENGTWRDLRPHIGNVQSVAVGINNAGQVVVRTYPDIGAGNNRSEGWIFDGTSAREIPSVADDNVIPSVINHYGVVVGQSGASGQIPFLYSDGQSYDINTLIGAGTGWRIDHVSDINDRGQILATGRAPDNTTHSVLLNPTNSNPFPRLTDIQ